MPTIKPPIISLLAGVRPSKPVVNRNILTQGQVRLYHKFDVRLPDMSEFPRGDEFYGRIFAAREKDNLITLKVESLVGKKRLEIAGTLNILGFDGAYLSQPLFIRRTAFLPDGKVGFVLEKPDNFPGEKLDPKPGMLVTTNSHEFGFKRKIRAHYDDQTIVVYQAFDDAIADQAVATQRFGGSFRPDRLTWIKTSFLWMMNRSDWGQKPGQTRVLAVHLTRQAFEELLARACVADPTLGLNYKDENAYASAAARLKNRVQWDPDKTVAGQRSGGKAIQVGIHPENHPLYYQGIVQISEITSSVKAIRQELEQGKFHSAMLPAEYSYPTPEDLLKHLEMQQYYISEDPGLIRAILSRLK